MVHLSPNGLGEPFLATGPGDLNPVTMRTKGISAAQSRAASGLGRSHGDLTAKAAAHHFEVAYLAGGMHLQLRDTDLGA